MLANLFPIMIKYILTSQNYIERLKRALTYVILKSKLYKEAELHRNILTECSKLLDMIIDSTFV
jgi:hypothetical protein